MSNCINSLDPFNGSVQDDDNNICATSLHVAWKKNFHLEETKVEDASCKLTKGWSLSSLI